MYLPAITLHAPTAIVILCGLKEDLRLRESDSDEQKPDRFVPVEVANKVPAPFD